METTVKQRLIEFLKSKNISQSKFEKQIGVSNGYVNNMRKSLQPDKLQRIALNYPELNTGWLMTGEGEMLKPSNSSAVKIGNVTANATIQGGVSSSDAAGAESLKKENEALRREMDDLRRERDRLAGANSALTEIIRQLTGKN